MDFGDDDPVSSLPETACWTYFGSGGENNIIDSDSTHSRTYYLDDQWHFYRLVRDANVVTVYLDGQTLGTAAYADSLGSDSPSAHQFIGRASVRHDLPHIEDPFPWFGYIGDVRVFDQAVPPEEFATNEHYACYQAKAADAGLKPDPKPSGTLTNQVANGTFEKCKFKLICVPTEKNDSGPPGNPALNYCGWQCKGFKGEVPFTVSDQFGSGAVVAKKLKFILNECTVSP